MQHIVTSRDGFHFVTESDPRSVKFDQTFAMVRTSEELAAHPDFQLIQSLDDIPAPVAAIPLPDPRAAMRARLTLIQGGKS